MSTHKRVDKTWGYELWIVNNELYCLKEIVVYQGKCSSEGKFHYHKIKDETFYILDGVLWLQFPKEHPSGGSIVLQPGDIYRIKPNTLHRFTALASSYSMDCRFMEVSTTHSDEDSYRVEA
jgi:quercetin dioxygenase-like cupin family protein